MESILGLDALTPTSSVLHGHLKRVFFMTHEIF